jgi:hypothetical protein
MKEGKVICDRKMLRTPRPVLLSEKRRRPDEKDTNVEIDLGVSEGQGEE